MKYRLSAVFLIALVFTSAATAQRASFGNPQSAMPTGLSGNIVTQDGRPVRDARVEVYEMMTGRLVASGYTLPGGTFAFNNVPVGRYEIRATAGLQEARERVEVESISQQITLRIAEAEAANSGDATVSVAEMRVPNKARKEFDKAQEAFGKHKMDEARSRCAKALAIAPTYSRALTLSALLDLTDNKLEDAAQKAEQSLKSDYSYGMGYVVLAAVYNAMQRYEDAIRSLDRGIPLTPNAWQAHFEMSKALLGKGDFKRALSSVDRALHFLSVNYPPIHLVRAHALLGLQAYSDAVTELEKYIGNDPNGSNSVEVRKTLDQAKAYAATSKK